MINLIIIVVALGLGSYLSFSPTLRRSSKWQALVTPLASIMGSGFLVSAPLLGGLVGNRALLCMAVLLLLAYAVGSAVRFNIRHFEPVENERGPAQSIAFVSRIVLAGAYFVSVSYYLQLLAAFVGQALGITDPHTTNLFTTALLLLIGGIGMWRGLGMLEFLEKYAVSLNLGMIASLLVALGIYNIELLGEGKWQLANISSVIDFHDMRVLLGLLIVVQGFETSRYLGEAHSADERIQTMRWAQLLSSCIYLIFIGLATVLFHEGLGSDVTAITELIRPVALLLPILIAIAAVGSQFSAAVADNEGAGGLIRDISRKKISPRFAYALILVITVVLTWATDVNSIIAVASRAFALFYMLQCVVALLMAKQLPQLKSRGLQMTLFAGLTLACLLVFILGISSE
ncbi:hypothetical protein [Rubritalea marina]|uniref:hypothetical protein n=1 Tax=Rubritalea marina TaxID=361055 RepID=UPI0003744DF4|nr:hypothetical protein [Rubritalea marina]